MRNPGAKTRIRVKNPSAQKSPNKRFRRPQQPRLGNLPKRIESGYRFLEHTSDAHIEAWGPTLEEAFVQAAMGFYEIMLNSESIEPRIEEVVNVEGHDEKELLYNWLEALLLKFDIDEMTYSQYKMTTISAQPGQLTLHAEISGEKYDRQKHGTKVEIKGITYHLMAIERQPGRATVRFILDL